MGSVLTGAPDINAVLVFADGSKFYGSGLGVKGEAYGEVCFNTSMTGYQEVMTDPSYGGQIINFTFPHIGNVGVNNNDVESLAPRACGLIIREPITRPANYRHHDSFNNWLIKNNLTGICGVDTRLVTKVIRNNGAKNVAIIYDKNIKNYALEPVLKKLNNSPDLNGVELAEAASVGKVYQSKPEGKWDQDKNSYNLVKNKKFKVVAVDYGAKLNILRCLSEVGCEVLVVPAKVTFEEILKHQPNGVFLSNGPGDPATTSEYAAPVIKKIIAKNIPLFGICLGHQLLALAMGAKTKKMHQGHRGANHPVQNLKTKKVEITSQNHGFCVDFDGLPECLEVTHISLFDKTIEGIKVKNKKAFSVQYHPESSPGPDDSYYLFKEFFEMMKV